MWLTEKFALTSDVFLQARVRNVVMNIAKSFKIKVIFTEDIQVPCSLTWGWWSTVTKVIDVIKEGKFRKRSAQKQQPKHEAPKSRNGAPKTRKQSTQNSKPLYIQGQRLKSLAWRKPNQVEAMDASAPPKVHQSIPWNIWFLACRGRAVVIFSGWALLSWYPFLYISLC